MVWSRPSLYRLLFVLTFTLGLVGLVGSHLFFKSKTLADLQKLQEVRFKDVQGNSTPLGMVPEPVKETGESLVSVYGLIEGVELGEDELLMRVLTQVHSTPVLLEIDFGYEDFAVSEHTAYLGSGRPGESVGSNGYVESFTVVSAREILNKYSHPVTSLIRLDLPISLARDISENSSECTEDCKKRLKLFETYKSQNQRLANFSESNSLLDFMLPRTPLLRVGMPLTLSASY